MQWCLSGDGFIGFQLCRGTPKQQFISWWNQQKKLQTYPLLYCIYNQNYSRFYTFLNIFLTRGHTRRQGLTEIGWIELFWNCTLLQKIEEQPFDIRFFGGVWVLPDKTSTSHNTRFLTKQEHLFNLATPKIPSILTRLKNLMSKCYVPYVPLIFCGVLFYYEHDHD